jgi:general secretion pathway protein N
MKKIWPLVALGIGAFVLFALFTLPAHVILTHLRPSGVTLSGVSGTLWNGRAQAVRAGNTHIGSIEWSLNVLTLFTGRLGAHVKITRSDGFAQGAITASPSGRIVAQELTASLPIATLPPNIAPGGWAGMLNLKFARLAIEKGWPVEAVGTVEAMDLSGPARNPTELGSYKIVFPAQGASSADAITGALTDTGGGPLLVTGTVQLKKDRSYFGDTLIATRSDAPAEVTKILQFLGEPDAQGRRPFTFSGTL